MSENFHRAAAYVNKILKGAKPGDLLVDFPTKLELIVNNKAAKALGLNIAPAVLVRAGDVIEQMICCGPSVKNGTSPPFPRGPPRLE